MAVPSSPWFRFHNGKEIQVPNASIYDGDVLVHVEGNEERCVTPGTFEAGPGGTYGWRMSASPPGEGWTLDRQASARKDFRVADWRRPRAQGRRCRAGLRARVATPDWCPFSDKADAGADIAE